MNKTILLFLVLFCHYSFSHTKDLGKVTVAELKQQRHSIDTAATAAILLKKGDTKFEYRSNKWYTVTTVKFKIKIFKNSGVNYANQQVNYYVGGSEEESVFFSDAITYNLVNNEIVKTKLGGNGQFVEKINRNWNAKKITLPAVKVGSIIEFSYQLVSPHITSFNDWEFQHSIPTDYVEYRVFVPGFFAYRSVITGYEKINSKSEEHRISEIGETINTYYKENVPPLTDEVFVNNMENYRSKIKFELVEVIDNSGNQKNIALDWAGVTKNIYEDERFGSELEKTNYFENDVTVFLNQISDENDKITAVYNYVKQRMHWNGRNEYFCDEGVKTAYSKKIGNVAEINLMLIAMLRYAGIEANPVLISTRSNGVSVFPTRSSFNYVVAGIEVEEKVVLLDATDPNALPDVLPIRALNWMGRIIRKNGSSAEINLMPTRISNTVVNLFATISNEGIVEGKVREQHYDYNAYRFRTSFENSSKENYLEYLEKKYVNIEISQYDLTGKKELDQPVVENYTFKSSNSVEVIGDKIYFSPLLFLANNENPFKQEKREFPIDFVYPNQERYIINITLPDGYTIESLPTSKSFTLKNNGYNFKFLISGVDKKIQLSYTKECNSSIVSPENYVELKEVFNEMIKAENQKIILKKT